MELNPEGNIVDAHTGQVIVIRNGQCPQGIQGVIHRGFFVGDGPYKGADVIVKMRFDDTHKDAVPFCPHKEAATLQELESALCKCPEVIAIYDNGFVMKDMGEHDLFDYIEAGVLSKEDIVNISEQLLQQMECYHTRGIFHGDIKPENVAVKKCGMTGKISVCYVDGGSARNTPGFVDVRSLVYASPIASQGHKLTLLQLGEHDEHCLAMLFFVLLHKRCPPATTYKVFNDDEKDAMKEHLYKIGAERMLKHFSNQPLFPLDHNHTEFTLSTQNA